MTLKACTRRPNGVKFLHFTGISDPYEEPKNPEITIETDKEQPEQCIERILDQLKKRHLLT